MNGENFTRDEYGENFTEINGENFTRDEWREMEVYY